LRRTREQYIPKKPRKSKSTRGITKAAIQIFENRVVVVEEWNLVGKEFVVVGEAETTNTSTH